MSGNTILGRITGTVGATALVLGGMFTMSAPASAEVNPHCSSVTKIGSTGYVTLDGETAASVKQFKGCGKNWAYTYVWQGFRADHSGYRVCTSIVTGDTLRDLRCGYGVETWSSGASTLSECTRAVGSVRIDSGSADARTSLRC